MQSMRQVLSMVLRLKCVTNRLDYEFHMFKKNVNDFESTHKRITTHRRIDLDQSLKRTSWIWLVAQSFFSLQPMASAIIELSCSAIDCECRQNWKCHRVPLEVYEWNWRTEVKSIIRQCTYRRSVTKRSLNMRIIITSSGDRFYCWFKHEKCIFNLTCQLINYLRATKDRPADSCYIVY